MAEVTEESIRAAVATAKPFTLLLLYKGPNYEAMAHLHMDHLKHVFALRADGEQLVTLPMTEDVDLRGVGVFVGANRERVISLVEADPAVQAGRFRYELVSCMGMPGDTLG